MCVVCLDTSIASSRQHCCDAFRSTIVPMAALPNPNKRLWGRKRLTLVKQLLLIITRILSIKFVERIAQQSSFGSTVLTLKCRRRRSVKNGLRPQSCCK
jgi:hypothetical protein